MKNQEVLDSWKEIADYLGKDIRTCYRWEKELGLPVHRIDDKSSRSKVFAYKSEIDQWLKDKAGEKDFTKKPLIRARNLLFTILISSAVLLILWFGVFKKNFFRSAQRTTPASQYPPAFDEISLLELVVDLPGASRESIISRLKTGKDPSQLYYQGKFYLNQYTRETNEIAIAHFLRAIEIDNNFQLAYLGLTDCYMDAVKYGWETDRNWLDQSETLLKRFHNTPSKPPELYSMLAKVYLLKAILFNEDTLPKAFTYIKEGLKEFPDFPRLNFLQGKYFFWMYGKNGNESDLKAGLEYLEKGYWLNPYALDNIEYAFLLMLNQDFDHAVEICTQLRNFDENLLVIFCLGEVYYFSGELERSKAIFEKFGTYFQFKTDARLYLCMIAAQMEGSKKASKMMEEIELLPQLRKQHHYVDYKLSSIYFGLKMEYQGYQSLESLMHSSAVQNRKYWFKRMIELDHNFDLYREKDRFKKLVNQK